MESLKKKSRSNWKPGRSWKPCEYQQLVKPTLPPTSQINTLAVVEEQEEEKQNSTTELVVVVPSH